MKVALASINRRALLRWSGAGCLALLVCVSAYAGLLKVNGNFHTVIDGELYRSAQPGAAAIEAYRRRYSIRTIVNLRGARRGQPWYETEVATARRLGIAHIDFAMSPNRELTQAEAAKLVALLEAAPKPILIHCQAGADRTGLASALYLAHVAKTSEERAEGQISLFFGHIGVPVLSRAYAIDSAWEKLEPWLGFSHS
jgi:protein tyrosine/serine phosphatase